MRIIIIFIVIFISCNTDPRQEKASVQDEKASDSVNSTIQATGETCYWQIMQRDTLVASLIQNGESITGKLTFDNFQKDGSSGTVKGKLEGDTIKLWYSFQSEGMHSVMEVWYRKEGDALLRGIGSSGVKKDTSYFTDPLAITFDSTQRLEKVSCSELPAKYK
jgi:hypothetical protein